MRGWKMRKSAPRSYHRRDIMAERPSFYGIRLPDRRLAYFHHGTWHSEDKRLEKHLNGLCDGIEPRDGASDPQEDMIDQALIRVLDATDALLVNPYPDAKGAEMFRTVEGREQRAAAAAAKKRKGKKARRSNKRKN